MKATLEFELPEDQAEFNQAAHAREMAIAIVELREKTRGWLKYGHDFKTPEEAIEAVRAMMGAATVIAEGRVEE